MRLSKLFGKYKKYFGITFLIVVFVSLLGGTYAIFQRIDEAKIVNSYRTGLLRISYTGSSEGINLVSQVPISDDEGMDSTPYEFSVANSGNLRYKFDLKLVIDSSYAESHGCAQNIIPSNYIKMSFNGGAPILLSDLTDNILVSDLDFAPAAGSKYNIRIWIAEGAPNEIMGKHFHGMIVSEGVAVYSDLATPPNMPVLADGMIPIKYDGTFVGSDNNWKKADSSNLNSDWYNYSDKMWANAVMVKSVSNTNKKLSDGTNCTGANGYCTRGDYMNANVGVILPDADILAYYVWIPRYKYQLFNTDFAKSEPQIINVQFERGTESTGNVICQTSEIGVETCTNKFIGNWYTHPAFTFGSEELEGIWVGKFETTYGTNAANVYPNNTVYTTPTIKPNVTSLRNQQISKQFQTAQYFGTTAYLTSSGANEVDAHMMKSIEWGAVAYLKQSAYGLGYQLESNDNSDFLTGRFGDHSYNENYFVFKMLPESVTNVSYNITNDTSYPWTQLSDGTYKSQTQGKSSSTTYLTVTFTLTDRGVISFDYSVSSESASSDYLYYTITNSSGTVIDSTGTSNKIGGTSYGTTDTAMKYTTKTHNLKAGSYTVVFTYRKDSSVDRGTDAGYVKNIKVISGSFIKEYFDQAAGQLTSTTGNVTGVYDTNGGATECVMAVFQDDTTTSRSPLSGGSGYIGKKYDSSSSSYIDTGNTLAFPAAKYYDLYAMGASQFDFSIFLLGDAIGEVYRWESFFISLPRNSFPWLARSLLFNLHSVDGSAATNLGFRSVVAPKVT